MLGSVLLVNIVAIAIASTPRFAWFGTEQMNTFVAYPPFVWLPAIVVAAAINGDISVRAFADTALMQWTPSPSGSVWRKRVHLVGPAESGQVTSVVRYEPASRFPAHDHPEGEEILVLEGVFSDEGGDWPQARLGAQPDRGRSLQAALPASRLLGRGAPRALAAASRPRNRLL